MGMCYAAEATVRLKKAITEKALWEAIAGECEYEERRLIDGGMCLEWSCDGKGDFRVVMEKLRALAAEPFTCYWKAEYMSLREGAHAEVYEPK